MYTNNTELLVPIYNFNLIEIVLPKKMIGKIFLVTLFAVCQAAKNEPWWIQMFFPNVSFTGKYHPSNYEAEKSPLFPDYVQNPNDVWSTAYWMRYKKAYAQYWIDLIDNTTKAEQEKQAQALGNGYGQYDKNGQYGYDGQYGYNGQYGQNDQYGYDGQYGQNGQYGFNAQYGQNGQYAGVNGQQGMNGAYNQNGQYQVSPAQNAQGIAEEAKTVVQQVEFQAEKMNQEAEQIVDQAAAEAEKQKQAVEEEAKQMKEVAAQAGQPEKVSAQIDKAAEAKKEEIEREAAELAKDIKKRIAPLNEQAQEVAMEAAEIAKDIESAQ